MRWAGRDAPAAAGQRRTPPPGAGTRAPASTSAAPAGSRTSAQPRARSSEGGLGGSRLRVAMRRCPRSSRCCAAARAPARSSTLMLGTSGRGSWSTVSSGSSRRRSHSTSGEPGSLTCTSAPSIGTSRAGTTSPPTPATIRVSASPWSERASATATRNSVPTASRTLSPSRPVTSRPTVPVRPRARARAAGSGPAYPCFSAVARMRVRRSALSFSGREKALETVIRLTPTSSAIDWRVGFAMRTRPFLLGARPPCGGGPSLPAGPGRSRADARGRRVLALCSAASCPHRLAAQDPALSRR